MKSNAQTLEELISVYINSRCEDTPPTEDQFDELADLVRKNNTLIPITDEEFKTVKNHLKANLIMIMDDGILLSDQDNGHKPWVAARRSEIDSCYWTRYKTYLETNKHWHPRATAKLSSVVDEILDQCGDPEQRSFHIKGLILGDVQSGKTSTYTALANKAADAGYKLIIVLAGIPEVLRQQTQGRLDTEFCGRQSNQYLDPQKSKKAKLVGVGLYNTKITIASFTSVANDFDGRVLKSNDLSLDNVKSPILLVVKKNKTILNNLATWLKYNNLRSGLGKIDLPMMMIDDEADNASVNTNNTDSDPTAINSAIRELLSLFTKTSYIAVTATPFANIFIDQDSSDPNRNNDLFPSDFIYALNAPNEYIGSDRIFGDDGDKSGMLIRINENRFLDCFPKKLKRDYQVNELPVDLYEAAYYFLLTNVIRDVRGDKTNHRTMMVHISRFITIQNSIAEILDEWLAQVKSDVQNYSKLSKDKSERIKSISDLHRVWDKYNLSKASPGLKWEDVLRKYIYKAIAPIYVRAVNGKGSSTSLDYDNHKEDGLRIIAIGGNMLSRGLTLEGLCVSYFYRSTNMYDTLMQMGRWFGYRPGYEDLVKIWLSQDEIDWYGQITDATNDLRSQIRQMRDAGLNPTKFGLKVRQDPGSLIVTAKNKMRTATTVKIAINVSGHLLETPRLVASDTVLEKNKKYFANFIGQLDPDNMVPESDGRTRGNYFWENVSPKLVSNLLLNFETHLWHLNYNGKGLSKYIDDNNWGKGWDVVLIKNGSGVSYPDEFKCGQISLPIPHTEKRSIELINNSISITGTKLRVGSGGIARIGLNAERVAKIKKEYESSKEGKTKDGKVKSVPDKEYLIADRPPILMMHVIQAEYSDDPAIDKQNAEKYGRFLFALGVGFPEDKGGTKTATYQVNLVELQNWIDVDNDTEDED